jgi:hypothetical protein
MKTCENCGSRVYNLGCVNCNEEAYIAEQTQLDELAAEDEAKTMWWGYRHISGSVQAKRFYNGERASIEDAHESDFCAQVVEPFEAPSREAALQIVASRTTKEPA